MRIYLIYTLEQGENVISAFNAIYSENGQKKYDFELKGYSGNGSECSQFDSNQGTITYANGVFSYNPPK